MAGHMSQLSDTVLLEDHLKRLRLPAMLRDYPECARQAREGGESYEGFLLDLVTRKLTQRQANQLKRRLKETRFPVMKTLEGTDFKKWPGLEALQVRELLRCDYIPRRENLAFIGRHGTGKSPAATVLGVEACRQGYRVLFQVFANRYERASVLVTSNLAFAEWTKVFGENDFKPGWVTFTLSLRQALIINLVFCSLGGSPLPGNYTKNDSLLNSGRGSGLFF